MVSPNQAHQGQTQTVTITGTYLTGATAVSFGSGITCTFTMDSATQITASISIDGSAILGSRDVSVTTPGGTATQSGAFTVLQGVPTISMVSPNQAHQGQTQMVTITGTYLTGATAVTFGSGITCTFTVDSATQITASISIDGSTTLGARDVSVTTPGGTATQSGAFTVLQGVPTITMVSTNQAHQGQTQTVTITGTYLTGATAVTFGSGITCTFTVDSATQITASISIDGSATLGARDVSVTTPGGTAANPSAFTVQKKSGGFFSCGDDSAKASTSSAGLAAGWAVVGLCWGTGYCLVRRWGRSRK
jgi:hypothetical protein